ncbi:MAG: DcaP family trimeric outer membrane transporter [Stellaceae bacterium]
MLATKAGNAEISASEGWALPAVGVAPPASADSITCGGFSMKRTIYTALATTAAVGLLAGTAFAQAMNSGEARTGVEYCTTTMTSPTHNNCVMPTAQAPGGGSFPGSFLVPGTNTSFAVHGFVRLDMYHWLGPIGGGGPNGWSRYSIPLNGTAAHSTNGGTVLQADTTRPNIETITPTSYGAVKTYIEFDFNQTGAGQLGGNNELLRLRQAYGTLGPWLIGQAYSLMADPVAYADTATGTQDAGMMNTTNVRRPEFRYTWLAGNGLSIAASAEQPTYQGSYASYATATGTGALGTLGDNETNASTGGYSNWPGFAGAGEWDQPWGHLKLALGVTPEQHRDVAGSAFHNASNTGYALRLSGHLNTIGKDALRGGFFYDDGGADWSSDMPNGGIVYNTTTGASDTVKAWAGYASYEHFFSGQWRGNVAGGYAHDSGTAGVNSTALAGIQESTYTTELNIVYSPVPQTDFFLEWDRAYRKMQTGLDGTQDVIDAQFNFYF